jgi:predicted deacylase
MADWSLPLTYDECRARFRWSAGAAGIETAAHGIDAPGPEGQHLTIDVAALGAVRPARALVLLSGVHGVEGFVGSALQCDLLGRLDPRSLPADVQVLLVHAVNPWGMAWWRRQNESNVDLNRNWARDEVTPPANDAYEEVHDLVCPSGPALPTPESFLERSRQLVEARGLPWLRDAISIGQYTHPDGLHFGGDRTEQSTRILAGVVAEHLAGVSTSCSVDLHTGHGARGTYTILSDARAGSETDRWLRRHFDPKRIEVTVDNPEATTARKVGQLGHGFADLLPGAEHRSVTFELGTVSDTKQILRARAEQWVHLHADRLDPAWRHVVWDHRCSYTPDDADWADRGMVMGQTVIDAALAAVNGGG